LPNCDGTAVPGRSYPSGHSTIGYSVGLMLAELMPQKASAILGRARDYALSRVICGVHYPADIDASHTLGTMVTVRLLLDPAVAGPIAAVRAELARAQTVPPHLPGPNPLPRSDPHSIRKRRLHHDIDHQEQPAGLHGRHPLDGRACPCRR
jgi:hypothetical protein